MAEIITGVSMIYNKVFRKKVIKCSEFTQTNILHLETLEQQE